MTGFIVQLLLSLFALKVPGLISQSGVFYSNDVSSP